jgi:hypothetical protein
LIFWKKRKGLNTKKKVFLYNSYIAF